MFSHLKLLLHLPTPLQCGSYRAWSKGGGREEQEERSYFRGTVALGDAVPRSSWVFTTESSSYWTLCGALGDGYTENIGFQHFPCWHVFHWLLHLIPNACCLPASSRKPTYENNPQAHFLPSPICSKEHHTILPLSGT